MSENRAFLIELNALFTALSAEHLLPQWLESFVDGLAKTPLQCRHDTFRPEGTAVCYSQGTRDSGKAMGIRKSTVLNSATDFLQTKGYRLPQTRSTASTKIRVHVLCFMRSFTHDQGAFQEAYQRLVNEDVVIAHLCGCGNCRAEVSQGRACTHLAHLALTTQGQNRNQVPLHDLLSAAQTLEEYNTLVDVCHRLPYGAKIF